MLRTQISRLSLLRNACAQTGPLQMFHNVLKCATFQNRFARTVLRKRH